MARRYQQPQGNARIDWSNPITRGLLLADYGQNNVVGTIETNPLPKEASVVGVVRNYNGASYTEIPVSGISPTTTPFTMASLVLNHGGGAESCILSISSKSGANRCQIELLASKFTIYTSLGNLAGTSNVSDQQFNLLAADFGMGAANSTKVWVNGKNEASSSLSAGSATYTHAAIAARFNSSYGIFGKVKVALSLIWGRVLTADEHASLSANPWQIFAPTSRQIFVPAAGGGGSVGLATETDTALPLSALQIATAGLAAESDSALALAAVQIAPVGLATETNTAFALLPGSPGTVGVAVETDTALALGGVQIKAVGLAVEADSALALNAVAVRAVGLATESDTAFALAAVQKMLVGIALETNTSLYLGLSGPPRIKGLRKTRYTPSRPPSSLGESGRYVQQELERITDGLESPFTHEMLELLSVEPGRKPTSAVMLAAADGANWNPGSGRGLYLYYGGTWALVKAF